MRFALLLLVCACSSSSSEPAATPGACRDAAIRYEASLGIHFGSTAEERRVIDAAAATCVQQKWSDKVLACFRTGDAPMQCEQQLAPDQRRELHAAVWRR